MVHPRIVILLTAVLLLMLGGCGTTRRPETPAAGCDVAHCSDPTHTFWSLDGATPAERFALAKRSEPELIAFLRRLPKGADLHNHLGGATYSDYLLDAARATGKRYDTSRADFTDATGDGTISLDEFESNAKLYDGWRDALSMRGALSGTVNGHDHFFQTFEHIGGAGRSADAMVAEVLERNRYQHVQYVELMTAPLARSAITRFIATAPPYDREDLGASLAVYRPLLDDPEIARAIRVELDARENAVSALVGQPLSEYPVELRYVLSLDRNWPMQRFFGATVLFVTAMRADPRFVAINIVGPEDAPASRRQFDEQMKVLDFLWHAIGPMNMTLHAGELSLRDSPVEPMQDRIRRTIDEGHARRIGHGTSIAWELDLPGLLAQMRDEGVLVEVALTSAQDILDLRDDRHPFGLYRAAGVPMCLSTDDEGVNRSNLTVEYVNAVRRYDLDYESVKDLSRNCLEYSFVGGESLYVERNYRRIRVEFGDLWRDGWEPSPVQRSLMDANPRIALQVRLELAFLAFEASVTSGFRESRSDR